MNNIMRLYKKDVEEYREIYKKEYGKEISYQEAPEQGTKLVNLMKLIYRPITKSDIEKLVHKQTNYQNLQH